MAGDGSWNVLEDLHFLLAKDESLHEELAHVCDILNEAPTGDDSDESSESTKSNSSPPSKAMKRARASSKNQNTNKSKARPHFEVRQKQEMLLLRQQVDELKRMLQESQAKAKQFVDMSVWEKAAKTECMEKHRVLQEIEQLKEAVHQQATFIEHMEKLCRKKPRLTADTQSEAWQNYRLAAQHSLRIAAIHAIADRQYRRMQNAFIQACVFGKTEDVYRAHVVRQSNNSFMFELINHMTLPAPFRVVSAAAWRIFSGQGAPTLPDGAVETLDIMDENTIYDQLVHHTPEGTTSYANIIRKRYVEADREVVVSRTVLEDALVPHMSKGAIENKWSWLEVTPITSNKDEQCRLTFVIQLLVDPETAAAVTSSEELALMEAMMQRVSLIHNTQIREQGSLQFATARVDIKDIPYPNTRGFIERGKLFIKALEHSVNDAIESYHQDKASYCMNHSHSDK